MDLELPLSWPASVSTRGLGLICVKGPAVRVSPSLIVVNDPKRLPDIYHRQANKSNFYINGLFGKTENVFNIRDWKQHAHFRKFIAGPVSEGTLEDCL